MRDMTATATILRRTAAAAVLAFACAAPAAAQNATVDDLMRRLDRMERDLAAVQRQVYSGAGSTAAGRPADPATADYSYRQRTEVRLGALEDQFRNTTGQIEQLGHAVDRMQKRLDKLVADVDYRLSELERRTAAAPGTTGGTDPLAAAPAATGEPPTTIISGSGTTTTPGTAPTTGAAAPTAPGEAAAPAAGLPQGTPLEQYAIGRRLLVQNQYDKAEQAFTAFLRSYPDHQLAENARYWLAETYYVRGDYQQAATSFLDTYQKSPTGQKAPDSLLKLGMSLDGLGKKREACVALDKLKREFPNASERVTQVAAEQRRKLACS